MSYLNITYADLSGDCRVTAEENLTDSDLRRIAVQAVRGGRVRGMAFPQLSENAFEQHMVDRFTSATGERRIYLRPRVLFGGRRSA